MIKFKLTSQDPEATATEGWSGLQERELPSIEAGVAWFAAEVIAETRAVHILQGPDGYEFARYEPQ